MSVERDTRVLWGERVTNSKFQIQSGRRSIAVREAPTAAAAVLDYVHSLGCRDSEIQRLAADSCAWRGAVFRAVPIAPEQPER